MARIRGDPRAERFVCFVLAVCVLFLCFGLPFQTARAIVGVSTAAIAIIIAGLAAIGITFVATGAYSDLSDYVGSLLEDYAADNSVTLSSLFSGTQSGVNSAGQLLLNNRYVVLISGFAQWLKLKFNLANNQTTTLQPTGSAFAGMTGYSLPISIQRTDSQQGQIFELITADADVVGLYFKDGSFGGVYLVSDTAAVVHKIRINSSGQVSQSEDITLAMTAIGESTTYYYWLKSNPNYPWSSLNFSGYTYYDASVIEGKLKTPSLTIDHSNIGVDADVGTISLPLDDPDYTSGDGAIVDVGAPWGATLPQVTDQVIPGAWAPGVSGNPTMTYDAAPSIQDQINPAGSQAIDQNPDSYGVPGLKDVFPFCIPFDLYAFVSALAADPVAPSFQWRFYFPGICDETVTLDLSSFDQAAQLLRTMELLAFCVGLAFETRHLLRS